MRRANFLKRLIKAGSVPFSRSVVFGCRPSYFRYGICESFRNFAVWCIWGGGGILKVREVNFRKKCEGKLKIGISNFSSISDSEDGFNYIINYRCV